MPWRRHLAQTPSSRSPTAMASTTPMAVASVFTNFGYAGAPILAEIDGTPSLIGIVSAGTKEGLRGIACSARQFEKTVIELMRSK
jgi:hypothetical protein